MAKNKKSFTGYKGKTSAKIIATGVTAGMLTLAIVGGSVVHKLSNRPKVDNPYNDDYVSDTTTNYPIINEPNIETDANQGVYQPSEEEITLPELQDPIIPDTNPSDEVEDLGVEFVEVLAKLTNESKDYIESVTGNTANITITGLSSMNVNANEGSVTILGQLSMGEKFNNFVATMGNNDINLVVYNLDKENITETDFVNALDELLSDENTSFKLVLKQYVKLSNESEVIEDILNTRLNELNALNSTEQSIADEIAHINALLEDSSKLKLSVLLNNRTTVEDGYNYSFSLAINTGKYVYSVDHNFVSKRALTSSALKLQIEEYLDTATDYSVSVASSSSVNQALYVINDTAFNLENEAESTLNK